MVGVLTGACSGDDTTTSTSASCVSGNGATVCARSGRTIELEGFLPGSTATVTQATTASGATATGTGASGTGGLGVTINAQGKSDGAIGVVSVVPATAASARVRGVSATNGPVDLTITLR
jgi:hypothetical protein